MRIIFYRRLSVAIFVVVTSAMWGCKQNQGVTRTLESERPNSGSSEGPASTDRGFNLDSPFANSSRLAARSVRLAYTGVDLFGKCGTDKTIFLPETYTQKSVLEPFSLGKDLFSQLISSWEAVDLTRVRAPASPAHPLIRQRLGAGTDPNSWLLNLVRFRSDHIKLNFELPLLVAGADRTLEFAALIHGFKIPADRIAEYQADIANLGESTVAMACQINTILSKWLPQSEYFFVHSNFFDLQKGVREWRFTEAKLVSSSNEILTGSRATAMGLKDINYSLRIVMMEFPFKQFSPSGTLVNSADGKVYRTFWSGETTDFDVDLLSPIQKGGSVASSNPAFEHDSSMTCAQCHARGIGPVAVDPGSPLPKQMVPVKSMNFRHVGFGIEPPHGLPRLYNQAQLSLYFQQLLLKESGR